MAIEDGRRPNLGLGLDLHQPRPAPSPGQPSPASAPTPVPAPALASFSPRPSSSLSPQLQHPPPPPTSPCQLQPLPQPPPPGQPIPSGKKLRNFFPYLTVIGKTSAFRSANAVFYPHFCCKYNKNEGCYVNLSFEMRQNGTISMRIVGFLTVAPPAPPTSPISPTSPASLASPASPTTCKRRKGIPTLLNHDPERILLHPPSTRPHQQAAPSATLDQIRALADRWAARRSPQLNPRRYATRHRAPSGRLTSRCPFRLITQDMRPDIGQVGKTRHNDATFSRRRARSSASGWARATSKFSMSWAMRAACTGCASAWRS